MADPRLSVSIRMTRQLVDRLKAVAEERSHSMNAEIVQRLERSFLDTYPASLPTIMSRLHRIGTHGYGGDQKVAMDILMALEDAYGIRSGAVEASVRSSYDSNLRKSEEGTALAKDIDDEELSFLRALRSVPDAERVAITVLVNRLAVRSDRKG